VSLTIRGERGRKTPFFCMMINMSKKHTTEGEIKAEDSNLELVDEFRIPEDRVSSTVVINKIRYATMGEAVRATGMTYREIIEKKINGLI